MPSSEVRQVCSVSFHPDSLGGSSVDSRGSSQEKQVDAEDVRKASTSSKSSITSTSSSTLSWSKSKKIEDELSQLWDTGQVVGSCQASMKA